MSFMYPLGLLGLIGVPILILIYIIKNRYTEQTVSSTYVWNLSEKFLKRRRPISRVAGIISLILQILMVVFLSFAISHPIITVPNSAVSYCFVLDGSGSMNFIQDGKTRFDIAKGKITDLIDDSTNGSEYTLIYAGNTTETLFEKITDKKEAKQALRELTVGYGDADMQGALKLAQALFNDNPSLKSYLVSDEAVVTYQNIRLINVAQAAQNYTISNVEYGLAGGKFRVSGTALSHTSDATVTLSLTFDDEAPYTQEITLPTLTETPFEFLCDRTEFSVFKVAIANADALMLDNEVVIYNRNAESVSEVLLVGESPFFIRAALFAAGITEPEFLLPKEYASQRGYKLYIFDNFVPEELPDDGTVWFINPKRSVAGANFSYQSTVAARESAVYAGPTSSALEKLLHGVSGRPFELAQYVKCALSGNFSKVITCEGNPLLFAGTNAFGNREAVFAFDLHDSAPFALSSDFSVLVKHLISYSFPSVVDDTYYHCGDVMPINMIAGCNNIKIKAPSGKMFFPDPDVAVYDFELSEVGVYSVTAVMKDKSERTVNVYAALASGESLPLSFGDDFTIVGDAANKKFDGYFDPLFIFIILLVVLAIADYGVYCYEQYQLR